MVKGKIDAGISVLLSKITKGFPGLTSPSDGKIAPLCD